VGRFGGHGFNNDDAKLTSLPKVYHLTFLHGVCKTKWQINKKCKKRIQSWI